MLHGPGLGEWDFSIVKDTHVSYLGERGAVEGDGGCRDRKMASNMMPFTAVIP
jgi:hypothetical protein